MTDKLIMELHRNAGSDHSPMQMISKDRLAYLERIEREWRLLRERVAAGVQISLPREIDLKSP